MGEGDFGEEALGGRMTQGPGPDRPLFPGSAIATARSTERDAQRRPKGQSCLVRARSDPFLDLPELLYSRPFRLAFYMKPQPPFCKMAACAKEGRAQPEHVSCLLAGLSLT